MADGKEYISHEGELGSVSISEEVLAVIAAAAAVDVEGVSCLGNGVGRELSDPANRKALTRGVRLWVEDERVSVDLPILVRYGYVVTDVAKAVQDAVFSAVENTSGLEVAQVNVTVVGVTFQK
ncbi:MAG: Asp23/Gls24 family envelope stress response protein [Oscillospiraceae bacterium]|nr:Asp23/Gls24 family envelope stress response protein [Oscillospiraceae bacterium]MDE7171948.1 Asp23/Gls24 family envelope stress response protein [Oscillospiraceae bacterium]